MIDIATNYNQVYDQVATTAQRCGRRAEDITIVCAAKTKSPEAVRAAIAAGATDIGENYVQEAREKIAQISRPVIWHLIGHLQRNKAKEAVRLFMLIHSLDTVALAQELHRQGEKQEKIVRTLIEVNLGGELTKSGIAPAQIEPLLEAVSTLPSLRVQGFMTIPPPGPDAEASRPYFQELARLRERYSRFHSANITLRELSMGMTDDYQVAIEEGATIVRIGRAIFGERQLANASNEDIMKKIGFIGAGNMAGALIKGLLSAKLYRPQDLLVSDAIPAQLKKIKKAYKVDGLSDNRAVVREAQAIVLAVKPQIIDQVLAEIQSEVSRNKLFISIAAGVPLRRLETGLGGNARVVRVMPNTPALLGKGIAVVVRGRKAKPQDEKLTLTMFRGVGEALVVKDEALMDPVTGLSGSGPAYVYFFAEALIAGGVQEGLDPKVATRLAYETIEGAVAMLKETGKSPKELRDMVTSPGGTTLAGLSRLVEGQFAQTVMAGVAAATRRSKELGHG